MSAFARPYIDYGLDSTSLQQGCSKAFLREMEKGMKRILTNLATLPDPIRMRNFRNDTLERYYGFWVILRSGCTLS